MRVCTSCACREPALIRIIITTRGGEGGEGEGKMRGVGERGEGMETVRTLQRTSAILKRIDLAQSFLWAFFEAKEGEGRGKKKIEKIIPKFSRWEL